MISQLYVYLGAVVLLMTLGRVVWRRQNKPVDWALIVAFIRLDFPPHQREVAQKIAAGLAEIVGLKIRELRPEHTIKQIADWTKDTVSVNDLMKVFNVAFNVRCDENTTFRDLVEMVAAQGASDGKPA
ncbi:MAG TPA: hypothetical protein VIE89_14120 [Candidatus Binatia bacterium]|jgi:hypothetical protein